MGRLVQPGARAILQIRRILGQAPKMDILKMLGELRDERDRLSEAILTLERLAAGRGRRRGRPPAWMQQLKRRGRPPGSKNKKQAVGEV